jgi:hypothetical protein
MDLKHLEARGNIEKANFSSGQIKSNLSRAQRDLRTAKANLKIDEEWAYIVRGGHPIFPLSREK